MSDARATPPPTADPPPDDLFELPSGEEARASGALPRLAATLACCAYLGLSVGMEHAFRKPDERPTIGALWSWFYWSLLPGNLGHRHFGWDWLAVPRRFAIQYNPLSTLMAAGPSRLAAIAVRVGSTVGIVGEQPPVRHYPSTIHAIGSSTTQAETRNGSGCRTLAGTPATSGTT